MPWIDAIQPATYDRELGTLGETPETLLSTVDQGPDYPAICFKDFS